MSSEVTLNIDIKVEEVTVNGVPVAFNVDADYENDLTINCDLTTEIAKEFLEEKGYIVRES